jgi:hypothetical protein
MLFRLCASGRRGSGKPWNAFLLCRLAKNLFPAVGGNAFIGDHRAGARVVIFMQALPRSAGFAIQFGSENGGMPSRPHLPIPVLAGAGGETLFAESKPEGCAGNFDLFSAGDWLVGRCIVPQSRAIGSQVESIYAELLSLASERSVHPVRIWNYVPEINTESAEGLEMYRAFCRGRSLAFERAGWTAPLPAASAVGCARESLGIVFAATNERPIAYENPEQVPAFEYPTAYGPRPPSFSRAMQVTADDRLWTFVSGTAAIKGHASQFAGDFAGQLDCTLDNLALISRTCKLGDRLAADAARERHFKIYLRRVEDMELARTRMEREWLRPTDHVSWLHTDICRGELLVEIEATVVQ